MTTIGFPGETLQSWWDRRARRRRGFLVVAVGSQKERAREPMTDMLRGGYFIALEEPALFAEEVLAFPDELDD